ncbi:hypothetical protein BCR34DRAFT_618109 [Clohesyomyces aquaticus]|uniref:Uncharacterized protein n=1 Tax=Clohesyomyces aquaticus TaxID=1231657 RepID=A0A1Y1YWF0_9PLEO|nr:hypothetical protein BCR34DRAFT_618109 [Clohesyomyces aquaticus]
MQIVPDTTLAVNLEEQLPEQVQTCKGILLPHISIQEKEIDLIVARINKKQASSFSLTIRKLPIHVCSIKDTHSINLGFPQLVHSRSVKKTRTQISSAFPPPPSLLLSPEFTPHLPAVHPNMASLFRFTSTLFRRCLINDPRAQGIVGALVIDNSPSASFACYHHWRSLKALDKRLTALDKEMTASNTQIKHQLDRIMDRFEETDDLIERIPPAVGILQDLVNRKMHCGEPELSQDTLEHD